MSNKEIDYIKLRKKRRYSHASIRLRIKVGDSWQSIRALDWNDTGFNFFIDKQIGEVAMSFKKDTKVFDADIVWCFKKNDDNAFKEALLNTLIFKRLEELRDKEEKDSLKKALAVVRGHENYESKKELLHSLGVDMSDGNLAVMLEGYTEQHVLYQYGVHVESDIWAETVSQVLKDTADMLKMDMAGEKLFNIMDKLVKKP